MPLRVCDAAQTWLRQLARGAAGVVRSVPRALLRRACPVAHASGWKKLLEILANPVKEEEVGFLNSCRIAGVDDERMRCKTGRCSTVFAKQGYAREP